MMFSTTCIHLIIIVGMMIPVDLLKSKSTCSATPIPAVDTPTSNLEAEESKVIASSKTFLIPSASLTLNKLIFTQALTEAKAETSEYSDGSDTSDGQFTQHVQSKVVLNCTSSHHDESFQPSSSNESSTLMTLPQSSSSFESQTEAVRPDTRVYPFRSFPSWTPLTPSSRSFPTPTVTSPWSPFTFDYHSSYLGSSSWSGGVVNPPQISTQQRASSQDELMPCP